MCRYWPPGSIGNILPGLLTPRSFCYIRKLNLLWASHYSYSRNLSALTLYLQKGHQNTVQSQKQGAGITGSCWACEMWVFFFFSLHLLPTLTRFWSLPPIVPVSFSFHYFISWLLLEPSYFPIFCLSKLPKLKKDILQVYEIRLVKQRARKRIVAPETVSVCEGAWHQPDDWSCIPKSP